MRVLPLEPFNEGGGFRRDGTGLPAVLTRFGRQRGQAVAAIAQGPVQQRVHRDLAAARMGNVVEAGGEFLSAACEFAAGQRFQHQGGDEPVAKQRDFFGFVIHGVVFSPAPKLKEKGRAVPCKWCVGKLRRARWRWRMRCGGRRERDRGASPAGDSARRRTGSGERRSSRWIRAWPGRGARSRARERVWSTRPARRTAFRLARESGESRTGRAGRASRAPPVGRRYAAFARGADGR